MESGGQPQIQGGYGNEQDNGQQTAPGERRRVKHIEPGLDLNHGWHSGRSSAQTPGYALAVPPLDYPIPSHTRNPHELGIPSFEGMVMGALAVLPGRHNREGARGLGINLTKEEDL